MTPETFNPDPEEHIVITSSKKGPPAVPVATKTSSVPKVVVPRKPVNIDCQATTKGQDGGAQATLSAEELERLREQRRQRRRREKESKRLLKEEKKRKELYAPKTSKILVVDNIPTKPGLFSVKKLTLPDWNKFCLFSDA